MRIKGIEPLHLSALVFETNTFTSYVKSAVFKTHCLVIRLKVLSILKLLYASFEHKARNNNKEYDLGFFKIYNLLKVAACAFKLGIVESNHSQRLYKNRPITALVIPIT